MKLSCEREVSRLVLPNHLQTSLRCGGTRRFGICSTIENPRKDGKDVP